MRPTSSECLRVRSTPIPSRLPSSAFSSGCAVITLQAPPRIGSRARRGQTKVLTPRWAAVAADGAGGDAQARRPSRTAGVCGCPPRSWTAGTLNHGRRTCLTLGEERKVAGLERLTRAFWRRT